METSAIASRLQLSGEVHVTELPATAVLRLISIGSSLIREVDICCALPERCMVADGDVHFSLEKTWQVGVSVMIFVMIC